jgi:hypothetical protein
MYRSQRRALRAPVPRPKRLGSDATFGNMLLSMIRSDDADVAYEYIKDALCAIDAEDLNAIDALLDEVLEVLSGETVLAVERWQAFGRYFRRMLIEHKRMWAIIETNVKHASESARDVYGIKVNQKLLRDQIERTIVNDDRVLQTYGKDDSMFHLVAPEWAFNNAATAAARGCDLYMERAISRKLDMVGAKLGISLTKKDATQIVEKLRSRKHTDAVSATIRKTQMLLDPFSERRVVR